MRDLLLFSTSTLHGGDLMEYAQPWLQDFLSPGCRLLFVPYARPGGVSHDAYARRFTEAVVKMGFEAEGIHAAADPRAAVEDAEALFVGGGNTFVLLRELYAVDLLEVVRARVDGGMPYLGSSAGSNVAGPTIGTTNDMPIAEPPSFDALGLMPFNINPHYLDPDPDSTHMGETRETRIREFLVFNPQPVIGLREGALLEIHHDPDDTGDPGTVELLGSSGARLFRRGADPEEVEPGTRLDSLLAG